MSANRISLLIAALAVVAVAAVLVLSGSDDGDDDPPPASAPAGGVERTEDAPTIAPNSDAHAEAHERDEEREAEAEAPPELPDDPDGVRGSDAYALTRPANLRRGLAVLEARRARVRGAFDGLRVAPGRIDALIVHPDDRRTNIQVQADFEVAFESTHDFPTQAGFRRSGLTARDIDVNAPARLEGGRVEALRVASTHDRP